MSCPIGMTGNNNAAVSIDGVVYPNESFQQGSREWQSITGQNNGDDFECIQHTVLKQEPTKVTSYLVENDWEALETLFLSKEIVPVITQTMTHVISATEYYRRETFDGRVTACVVSPVSNSEFIKVDWSVQPMTLVSVTSSTDDLLS